MRCRRPHRVKQALEEVRARFGPINGVIHAAGVMDDEPIESKSLELDAARSLSEGRRCDPPRPADP